MWVGRGGLTTATPHPTVVPEGPAPSAGARLCLTPWTAALQAPLSVGFSRQECWSGLPFPPPGDLPNPRIKPTSQVSPALAGGFFTISTTWEALLTPDFTPYGKGIAGCPHYDQAVGQADAAHGGSATLGREQV